MTVLQPSCPCFSFLAFYHLEALSFQGKLNILYMIKQIMHDGNQVLIASMELAPFFFFLWKVGARHGAVQPQGVHLPCLLRAAPWPDLNVRSKSPSNI